MSASPPAYRFDVVLVATYGRTGSTLLMGLLNAIPGFLIRGENYAFAYHLFEAYRALETGAGEPFTLASGRTTHPWFGIRQVDLLGWRQRCAELIRFTLLPHPPEPAPVCIGFKDIHYTRFTQDVPAFLDFMHLIFPRLGVIVLRRDLAEVATSDWWGRMPRRDFDSVIPPLDTILAEYATANPGNCFALDYADMTGRTERLRATFDFLGAPYDATTIEHVMAAQHSTRTERATPPATTAPTTG
jgi:hypothetical protein